MSIAASAGDSGAVAEHAAVAEWDAAYVLGALSPTDRARYVAHLDVCDRCRAAVAELSGLPGLLDRVAADDVVAPDVPPVPADLLPRLLASAADRRRRTRRRVTVTAGLATAAAAAGLLVAFWPGDGMDGRTVVLRPVVANPLSADATLVAEPWGTRVDLRCRFAGDGGAPGPDRDYDYRLFVTNRAGVTTQAGGWTYGPQTESEPVGSTGWPVDQISVLQVRAADGTLLLQGTAAG